MAPKKSRQPNASSQDQMMLQAEPPRAARAGRKRKASDASTASERPTSSQSIAVATSSAPAKRRKRGKTAAVAEQEAIVEEEHVEEDMEPDTTAGAAAAYHDPSQETDAIQVSQKSVHFSGPSTQADIMDASSDNELSTATHLTPHPGKMPIKRRFTASPSVDTNGLGLGFGSANKRVKKTYTRSSLPAGASQENGDAITMREEWEFAPLNEILYERMRELRQSQGSQELDDKVMVWNGQAVAYPQLPDASASGEVHIDAKPARSFVTEQRLSQSQSQTSAWDKERRTFQDAILSLSQESQAYKSRLEVLRIELAALGIGTSADETDVTKIVAAIRETFTSIREDLLAILPDTLPDNVSNQDLLEIVIANLQEFSRRLQVQDKELGEKNVWIDDLSGQIQSLLDHLAEAELRKQQLEQRFSELDRSAEGKDRENEELQEEIQAITEERDVLEAELEAKQKELLGVQTENGNFAKTVTRLSESLEHYRSEEVRLQAIIVKMEETHRIAVTNMNKEREETVVGLENQIDEATNLLTQHTQLAGERQTTINNLEIRITELEAVRDGLTDEVNNIKVERDEVMEAKGEVDEELADQNEALESKDARINELQAEIAELGEEVESLRQLNVREREQRELAEADLDDRHAQIEELNAKLREAGVQANELRTQLFGAQEDRKKKVNKLELLLSERDEQYQVDITAEVERRETAEDVIQARDATILELEGRLLEVEQNMLAIIAERDAKIASLETTIVERNGQIEALNTELDQAQENYDNQVAESEDRVADLKATIVQLNIRIEEHQQKIEVLEDEATTTTDLHNSEMDDRNDHIAELNHTLTQCRTEISHLETAREGLERRVEGEALQMLNLQTVKDEEIEDLKQKVLDQRSLNMNIEQKANAADARWQELLQGREQEIQLLTESQAHHTETIGVLTADIEAIRKRFRDYVDFAASQNSALRELLLVNAEEVEGNVKGEGERALEEIDGMVSFRQVEVVSSSQSAGATHSRARKAKATRGKKQRVKDSGIGIESGEEEMLAA